jgi:flagellar basal body-associated protein FliL
MNKNQTGSAKLTTLIIILAVVAILAIAVMMLPKGFKDDLSLIGQGKVSVVLTHDKNIVASVEMMETLNAIRADYEDKVEFLAVDIATPVGNGFMRDQAVGPVVLVVFNADGTRQQVLRGDSNASQVRAVLDGAVGG